MITIKKAQKSDSQKIKELEEKIWKEKGVTSSYDIVTFVEDGLCYIAKDKEKIIGGIISIKTWENKIKIIDWFVDKNYQKKGIGKKLYERIIKNSKNKEILSLVNSNNKNSQEIHKKIGFKIIKKINDPYNLGNKNYSSYLMKLKWQ